MAKTSNAAAVRGEDVRSPLIVNRKVHDRVQAHLGHALVVCSFDGETSLWCDDCQGIILRFTYAITEEP